MITGVELLECLPVAVYTTDAEGRITFYNEAAATLWGHRPELGSSNWCGSWRLYWPDGRPMRHEECPMAVALKEGRAVRGAEAIAERPDGTRVPFVPYPTPLLDDTGRITGAINLLVDTSERQKSDFRSQHLAAIVSSSDDAIISKTLDGRITSWNAGATRIFGYEAKEMIGGSIMRIIPPNLRQEETEIIEKLRKGERIEHFDTVRVARDGRRVNVSLTVSPLQDKDGNVIGASKVARDITQRKRNEELQRLLTDELNHRVKNTLATVQAIASQSLHRSASPGEFVASFNGRVQALARAHDLLVQRDMEGAEVADIVREQVLFAADSTRIRVSGPRLMLDANASVQVALVLHELATNARKYGALSTPSGWLSIGWQMQVGSGRALIIEWKESGVADVRAPASHGFGATLIERSLRASGGGAVLDFDADGVSCRITLPLSAGDKGGPDQRFPDVVNDVPGRGATRGCPETQAKRILVIEDEAVIAMNIEEQLTSAGYEIVGPAASVESAKSLLARERCDAALLDVNLAGRPVDELAAALTRKGVPFVFATGYRRDSLPNGFREAPVLAKPFGQEQLIAALAALFGERPGQAAVVPLRPNMA